MIQSNLIQQFPAKIKINKLIDFREDSWITVHVVSALGDNFQVNNLQKKSLMVSVIALLLCLFVLVVQGNLLFSHKTLPTQSSYSLSKIDESNKSTFSTPPFLFFLSYLNSSFLVTYHHHISYQYHQSLLPFFIFLSLSFRIYVSPPFQLYL